MMLGQGPTPVPPGSEMTVGGSLEGAAAVILLFGVALLVAGLLWPLIRAVARRIESGGTGVELQAEVDALRERVRQLEEVPMRMAELEERVDFAERVVAKGREPDRLER